MLDEAKITGSNGKTVDLKNAIIIMTSNLGSKDGEANNIGFGSFEKTGEDDKALKEFFKPEMRNRIDQICKFKKLDSLAIKKVVIKFVDELKTSLHAKGISLNLSEPVIEHLAEQGYDSKMGARPLSRKIDELIRVPLSKKILFERLTGCDITAILVDDKIAFEIVTKVTPGVNADGIICVDSN
jgi:ATP-dependent Clp protease ATP-binding subunit ClpA